MASRSTAAPWPLDPSPAALGADPARSERFTPGDPSGQLDLTVDELAQ